MNTFIATTHQVDLVKTWTTVWAAVSTVTGYNHFKAFLTIIGLLLVVFSVGWWLWFWIVQHQRPPSIFGLDDVFWTMAVGVLLILPDVVVPALLTIADVIINAGIHLLG